jgi:CRP-like cAMP-binding protein
MIYTRMRLTNVSPGQKIAQKFDVSTHLYVVVKGLVQVLTADARSVDFLVYPGQVFCETALLYEGYVIRDHVAHDFVHVASLSRADFDPLLALFPRDFNVIRYVRVYVCVRILCVRMKSEDLSHLFTSIYSPPLSHATILQDEARVPSGAAQVAGQRAHSRRKCPGHRR